MALEQNPGGSTIPFFQELDLVGARVLVRLDLNAPVYDGAIMDEHRISQSAMTVTTLERLGAEVTVAFHHGSPGKLEAGGWAELLVRKALARHVGHNVAITKNLRIDPREAANEVSFAAELSAGFDAFVTDAFSVLHRNHASIVRLPDLLPSAAGLLIERELYHLSSFVRPPTPFLLIVGGAKFADKLRFMQILAPKAAALAVGGLTAMPFLAAAGLPTGSHPVSEGDVTAALNIMEATTVLAPRDFVVRTLSSGHAVVDELGPDDVVIDIGPESMRAFLRQLGLSRAVFWNGPLGVFELEAGRASTIGLTEELSHSDAHAVAGGGHTAAAIRSVSSRPPLSHLSTGGGAALAFLADGDLPGLAALRLSKQRFADRYSDRRGLIGSLGKAQNGGW